MFGLENHIIEICSLVAIFILYFHLKKQPDEYIFERQMKKFNHNK